MRQLPFAIWLSVLLLLLACTSTLAEEGRAGATPTVADDSDFYGGAYTPAELAALDKALWSENLTRTDLNFDKDFGKGCEYFPIVREMMADPLLIAPVLDELVHWQPPSFFYP